MISLPQINPSIYDPCVLSYLTNNFPLSLDHLYSPFSIIFGLYQLLRGKFATVAAEYFTLLFG